MSKQLTDSFCYRWLADATGRKAQDGNFYTIKANHVEFLCWCGASGHPAIIAMRDRQSGILILDKDNAKEVFAQAVLDQWLTSNVVNYFASFRDINNASCDLAEIKPIDCTTVQTNCGVVSLVLYDVNGYSFYTELDEDSYCATREEYLTFQDFRQASSTIVMRMLPTHNTCNDALQARGAAIPGEARGADKEFKTLNDCFLIPTPDMKVGIPSPIWQASRWMPAAVSWGLPRSMFRAGGRELEYAWTPKYTSIREFEKKLKAEFSDEVVEKCVKWRKAYDKWAEAATYVATRTDVETISHGFTSGSENVWKDELKKNYVKGKIQTNVTNTEIDVGGWHQIVSRLGKDDE
jgi:hypothetical protein